MITEMLDQLNSRLQQIEAERQQIENRLTELNSLAQAVRLLINDENARLGRMPPIKANYNNTKSKVGRTRLGRFAFTVLDEKWKSLDDCVQIAYEKGIDFGDKNPGRVLHRTFSGLKGNGYSEKKPNRSDWKLSEKGLEVKQSIMAEIPSLL